MTSPTPMSLLCTCSDPLRRRGTRSRSTVAGPADAVCPRVAEILAYVMNCSQQYVNAAVSASRGVSDMKDMGNTGNYGGKGAEPVESLIAERLSLPERRGTFDAAAYLTPHLAAKRRPGHSNRSFGGRRCCRHAPQLPHSPLTPNTRRPLRGFVARIWPR